MPPRRIRPVEPGPPNRTEHHFWLTRVQRSSRGRRWGAWDGGYGAAECHPITLYAPVPYAPRPFPPPYLLISRMSEYGRNRENRPFSPICPCCITFLLTGLIQHGQAAPASHSAQRRLRCELWPSPGAQTAPGTDPRAPRAPLPNVPIRFPRPYALLLSLVPTLCVGTRLLAAPRPLPLRGRLDAEVRNLPRVTNPREAGVGRRSVRTSAPTRSAGARKRR